MRKFRILLYIFILVLFASPFLEATHAIASGSSYPYFRLLEDTIIGVKVDSARYINDSIISDSLAKSKSALDNIVDYVANDSIVMTGDNWGFLYGESKVDYTDLSLQAEKISFNLDSSIAKATFGIDTAGVEYGYPVFTDKGTNYEAKNMRYNLKSKKMHVNGVITEQGEGFVSAGIAKKTEEDAFYMSGGRYTTCDDHDCPHFYLALTKAKVRPKKDVVTGPAYLVIEGLPLPLGLPFGFFPFSDKYSSGVIMPSFGDEMERGFFLKDGGYYFAINDNIDLRLTGEIYTKGSWGLNAQSTYRKRYRYSGNFDAGYLLTKRGDKGIDQVTYKDLKVNWTHSQDPKANMFRTFSASVNFSTSSYNQNQWNSISNPMLHTQNNKASSITMTQRIPNSPWSFSGSMNIDQRSADSTISMTLPNMTITMSRISPFKRKDAVGKEKWYEKIQLSYRGELRNSIQTKEDKLFNSSLKKDWKKGMKHVIPVSATFTAFDYLNITPSFSYTERWYTEKNYREWDSQQNREVVSKTKYGFNRVWDFNASLSLQTKMYGFYKPLFDKKTTIRHVFTPSISFGYSPDFSNTWFGYYDQYHYFDPNGEEVVKQYSLFQGAMFGAPGVGKQGNINFQFDNNVEMKREMNDTIKKISLIDNLGINFSYNMMAKEFKWSDIRTNMRLKLSKSLTVNLNATWDPYTYELKRDRNGNVTGLERQDRLRIGKSGKFGFGRLMNTSYSISPSINQDTFKKWFGKDEKKNKPSANDNDGEGEWDDELNLLDDNEDNENDKGKKGGLLSKKKDSGDYDEDGYIKNEIKWSLSANYSFNYAYNRSRWDEKTKEYKYKLTQSLGLNGSLQPTKNWSFNISTNYDFDAKKLSYVNCSLTRDLHCWSITASFIPVGPYKSYFVSLRASSSMLQDLKYDKRGRSYSYDPDWD